MIAGPSEVLVLADAGNDPDWLALDLLAQAEHDESAGCRRHRRHRLRSRRRGRGRSPPEDPGTQGHRQRQLARLRRGDHRLGLDQAVAISDRIAPEHLQVCTADAEGLVAGRIAGAIFLGAMTPEAIGDYVGGPNHVLPTARSSRFSSGLSVLDFMKRTTIARMTPSALAAIGPAAERLARPRGSRHHGLSIRARYALAGC